MVMISYVTLSQPMSRLYNAYLQMHTSSDYPNGDGISQLLPGDGNWQAPHDGEDGGTGVLWEIGNIPPYSNVRINVYADNDNSGCAIAGTSGSRVVVDIWVSPYVNGSYRAEKYLGYGIYQHLGSINSGTHYIQATPAGWANYVIGTIWGYQGLPAVYADPPSNQHLCWTAPHCHHGCSRDPSFESAYGTYTTGVSAKYGSGQYAGGLGAGSESYRWSVDWDK